MILSLANVLNHLWLKAIEKLTKHKEIKLTPEIKQKLLLVSASTIDRLLKSEKDRCRLGKGRSGTKPGSLLKKAIPIRTFADWDEKKPGYIEADLVGHDGGTNMLPDTFLREVVNIQSHIIINNMAFLNQNLISNLLNIIQQQLLIFHKGLLHQFYNGQLFHSTNFNIFLIFFL